MLYTLCTFPKAFIMQVIIAAACTPPGECWLLPHWRWQRRTGDVAVLGLLCVLDAAVRRRWAGVRNCNRSLHQTRPSSHFQLHFVSRAGAAKKRHNVCVKAGYNLCQWAGLRWVQNAHALTESCIYYVGVNFLFRMQFNPKPRVLVALCECCLAYRFRSSAHDAAVAFSSSS